jgi:hypothetical protein
MKKILYFSFLILLSGLTFAQTDILVNWECNMEIEILSGRFNTADTVAARGTFNGWSRSDLVTSLDPNVYVSEFPDTVMQAMVGDTMLFKFYYTPNTWESISDRIYVFTETDSANGEVTISEAFNDATLSTVTNQETDVLFQVDCNNALVNGASCPSNGQPFPAVHTVHIAGGIAPLQWPSAGWPDSEIGLLIALNDYGMDGDKNAGDGIFSGTVTFPAYTVFHVEYKFGINYGLGPDSTGCVADWNDNEQAIGSNHIINLFSTAWYCETLDTFGTMGEKNFVTDVPKNVENLPTDYALDQNYPNPFNPNTKISFSIPVEGFVALDVYNSIGQKVATLVNENKTAGSYEVNFNAANLSSGVYFYKLTSGSFINTKKMILMK